MGGPRTEGQDMLLRRTLLAIGRDRAVAATLTALLLLATLLACAGAGLMARLVGSADSLLERADAPHLVQMHAGEVDLGTIEDFAASRPEVVAHQVMPMLGIDGAQLLLTGQDQSGSVQQNSLVVPAEERDLLLDEADRPLTAVAPGTIHLPVIYRDVDGLETGDLVTITAPDGFTRDLVVAGFVRDSTMNTAIAGSKRLAVSAEDLEEIAAHTGTWEQLISFWVTDPDTEIAAVRTAYQQQGLPGAGPMVDRSAFVLFTVFAEGLVSTVVLLAAVMVLVVALLCLRLSLRTALERDRREIAVMEAIGIAARDIRAQHQLQYGLLAAVAAVGGYLGSLALEPQLSAGLTRSIGDVGGPAVVLVPLVVAILLVAGVLLGVDVLLRRSRRLGPVAVLRGEGTEGARPGKMRLHRTRLPVGPALGIMALRRRGGGGPLLVGVFAISTVLLILPAAVASTISSPQFTAHLGMGDMDVRADIAHTGPHAAETFQAAEAAFASDPRIADHTALIATRNLVDGADGTPITLPVSNGDHADTAEAYAEGRAPQAADEIALSLLALDETGAAVGDTLMVEVAGERRALHVVGGYQDLTYGGITGRALLDTEGEEVLWYGLGATLVPGGDAHAVADDLAAELPGARIAEVGEYRDQLLGPIADRLDAAALLAVLTGLGLAALLAVMIGRLWIAADAPAIAIQDALGASAGDLRTPYLTRMLLPLGLGAVLGAIVSLTLGQQLFNLLLEGMFGGVQALFRGTSRIELAAEPLTTLAGPPLLLAAVVVLSTLLTTRAMRTATVRTLSGA